MRFSIPFIFLQLPLLILFPQYILVAEAEKYPSLPKNCYLSSSAPAVMSTDQWPTVATMTPGM